MIARIAVGTLVTLAVVYAFALQRTPGLPYASAADPLRPSTVRADQAEARR
ncbi:MAG: hypothetical protein U1E23_06670 [Reyranellaceae bacterium]